jgi:hypothetical protein
MEFIGLIIIGIIALVAVGMSIESTMQNYYTSE